MSSLYFSPILAKSSAGAGIIGFISLGSVYGGTDLLSSKTPISSIIRDFRKDRRFITNNSTSDPFWKAAWKKYRDDNSSKNLDIGNIKGGSKTSGDDVPKEFIDSCNARRDQGVVNENRELYIQVLTYCTRATLVSDLIAENNSSKRILNKSENGSSEGGRAAGSTYHSDNSIKAIHKDKGSLDTGPATNNNDAPSSFISECEKRVNSEAFELTNSDYLDALKGCTA